MTRHIAGVIAIAATIAVGMAAARPQSSGTAPASPVPAPAGAFVWHDLVTDNPAACRAFYAALLGWTFEDGEGVDPGYTIIRHGGVPIGGIVTRPRVAQEAAAQWITYVAVDNVDRAVETFRRAGGRVFRGPLNARKDLRVAVVADPQGAPIGLASRGPRVFEDETPPGLHTWLWMEYVAARDTAAALTFYRDAIGFGHQISEARENFTYYVLTTDRPRAGMFASPWKRDTSAWLPYVRVEHPAAMAARATELGGAVALAPAPGVRNGSLAIVLDPAGAPLALQKFPFDTGVTQ
jgi:hypothetical protein